MSALWRLVGFTPYTVPKVQPWGAARIPSLFTAEKLSRSSHHAGCPSASCGCPHLGQLSPPRAGGLGVLRGVPRRVSVDVFSFPSGRTWARMLALPTQCQLWTAPPRPCRQRAGWGGLLPTLHPLQGASFPLAVLAGVKCRFPWWPVQLSVLTCPLAAHMSEEMTTPDPSAISNVGLSVFMFELSEFIPYRT